MTWIALTAAVVLIDATQAVRGRPTLSREFREASRKHPALVTAATAYLVAHLYGAVPQTYDPLRRVHLG